MLTFHYYITEIQYRAIYIFFSLCCSFFSIWIEINPILLNLAKPLNNTQLILTNVSEFWLAIILGAFFIAIYTVYPIFIYNLWAFLSPALFQTENRILIQSLISSFFIHIFSFVLVIHFLFPNILQFFFLTQAKSHALECLPSFYSYIKLVVFLVLGFAIICQIFHFFFILVKFQMISDLRLINSRKIYYFIAILVSAFLSPPDPVTQICLSLVLCFFYEILIYLSIWFRISSTLFYFI